MRFVVYSILCHLVFFVVLVGPRGCGGGSGQEQSAESSVQLFDMSEFDPAPKKDAETSIVLLKDKTGDRDAAGKDCKGKFYGGLGVTISMAEGSTFFVVGDVAHGYVGESLGLKTGDTVESFEEVKGEVGKPVTITINHEKTVTFIRDKICYH